MRVRLLALGAMAGVALVALPAQAAPVRITDPKGDSAPGGPSTDITEVSLQTIFAKKVVKKKVRRVPRAAQVTLTLAGPVDDNTFYSVDFTSSATPCKSISLVYDNNALPLYHQNRAICDDQTPVTTIHGPVAVPAGSKLVWKLPLSAFPVGTTFSQISASTWLGQVPAFGYDGTDPSSVTYTVGR